MVLLSKVEVTDSGQWFDYYISPDDENDKIEFSVGSTASESYRRFQRKLGRKQAAKHTGNRFKDQITVSDKDQESSLVELALELLQGWRGLEVTRAQYAEIMKIELGDANPDEVFTLAYTQEHARALMSHPSFGDMREFVFASGNDIAKHTQQHTMAAVENSRESSDSN